MASDVVSQTADALREYLAERDVACPRCGYNLRGLSELRCPECGLSITESRLFPKPPEPTRGERFSNAVWWGVLTVMLGTWPLVLGSPPVLVLNRVAYAAFFLALIAHAVGLPILVGLLFTSATRSPWWKSAPHWILCVLGVALIVIGLRVYVFILLGV